jgi:hypothetical protein
MVAPPRRPPHSLYFGSIPHSDLLKSVARRVVDRRVLHLIKMWLDCPVEETDKRGRKTRTTEAREMFASSGERGEPCGMPSDEGRRIARDPHRRKNPATTVPQTPLPNVTYAVGGVAIMAGENTIAGMGVSGGSGRKL